MPQLIWCCLSDDSSEFFNAAFYAFTGISRGGTIGLGWQQALHPDDCIELMHTRAHSELVAQPFKLVLRIRAINGAFQPFALIGEPVLDASGGVAKWLYSASPNYRDSLQDMYSLENDRYFRAVVDAIPGMVCTLTTDMQTEYCNQALLDFYGLPLEEIRNWATNGATHPDDISPSIVQTKHSIATGEGFDVERRLRRFDGEFRWIRLSGKPLRVSNGRIVRWYLSLTDIHETKLAETATQTSEQHLRVAIDTMPVLAWSSKADGDVNFFNQQWRDYTGLSTEEAKGWRWVQAIHPDQARMLPARWEKTLSSGQSSQLEALFRRYDGEYRWFLIRVNPLRNEQGQIVQWYGTNTDIHDLKIAQEKTRQSEAWLADVQRVMRAGSFSWGLESNHLTWSLQLSALFALPLGIPVDFKRIARRVHPEDISILRSWIAERRRTPEHYESQIRLLLPDGLVRHVRCSAKLVRHDGGRLEYIGLIQDITEKVLAEEALARARTELAKATGINNLGVLTASIAHEVNQPLAGIVTNASSALRMLSSVPPNVDGALETSRRTIRDANRAADVIARVRNLFARETTVIEAVDLVDAMREVIELQANDIRRSRIVIRTELEGETLTVKGDRVQLQQVMINLLRNAIDALLPVTDVARDVLIRLERETDSVNVSFRDVGIGFDTISAVKLFEPFYSTKADGMGIGLSVSQSIMVAHGGTLWALRNTDRGATFGFRLPIAL